MAVVAVAVVYLDTSERPVTAKITSLTPQSAPEPADSAPPPRFQNPHLAPPPASQEFAASTPSLTDWADSLPVEALARTLTDAPPEKRQALLGSWARRDLRGLAAWFGQQSINDELHQNACAILAEELGRHNATAHFAWLEQSLPESARRELYTPFFRTWTKADPAAAAAKLQQLADGSSGAWDNVIGQVAATWAATDTPRAMAWLESLPDNATKGFTQLQATYHWVEVDPPAAAAYADQRHDPTLLKAVATKWAELDPPAAAAWAAGLAPEHGQHDALGNTTAKWAVTDPDAVARWVTRFPEGPAREQVAGQLVTTWAGQDPAGAARWLQTLPPARSRDLAVSAFCNVTASTAPDLSLTWAAKISDPALRAQRLQRTTAP